MSIEYYNDMANGVLVPRSPPLSPAFGHTRNLTIHCYNMSNDELKVLAVTTLVSLLKSGKLSFPMTAMSLLTRIISTKPSSGLFSNPSSQNIRFKLSDRTKFQNMLEELSRTWDQGTILLSRENGEMVVLDIVLEPDLHARSALEGMFSSTGLLSRKRKRIIDEDDDSAAGDQDVEDPYEDIGPQMSSTLGSLGKEMREAYAILQKSTARGRLLAEQVRTFFSF